MRRLLLWFKQDLRPDDHPAQFQSSPLGGRRLGVHRARFLLESLAALDGALRQHGSHLLVL